MPLPINILYNAKIYTLDASERIAGARPIGTTTAGRYSGVVLGVGSRDELFAEFGAGASLENLEGRTVLPGLTDAHIHLENFASGLQKVDCETPNRSECLRRVAERAASTPPGAWILGHGWAQAEWPEGFGTAADLDAAAPDHPVYLTAKSLHAAWANTAALRLARIDSRTTDPPGGRLSRDDHGTPTGILFERAMGLVSAALPEISDQQAAENIAAALPHLWRWGLTGVHDFDRRRCFSALQILHARRELKLRVSKSVPVEELEYAAALGLRSGFGDQMLQIGPVKAFADGALGPRTAAMLAPYEGEAENTGVALMDREELFEHGRRAALAGFHMAVHAIGDRANHEVLAAFSQLREFEQDQNLPRRRHRIEHLQLLHPDDLEVLERTMAIASMQPLHATSDMVAADTAWGNRSEHAYAWRTVAKRGVPLAFGSDAPVENPNPFLGIHAAVTRRRADGSPGPEGWYPVQRLSVAEALRGYTQGAAFAAGREHDQGMLAPGYLADLIVLDTDPHICEPDELLHLHPKATMIGGDWVYRTI